MARHTLTALLFASVLFSTQALAAPADDAIAALKRGDYSMALRIIRPLAQPLPGTSGSVEDANSWAYVCLADAFCARVPPGTAYIPARGIDSLVGYFEGPMFSMTFDFGWYSGKLPDWNATQLSTRSIEPVRLQNRNGYIVTMRIPGGGPPECGAVTGIFVPPLEEDRRGLEMFACAATEDDLRIIKQVLRGITISDRARNRADGVATIFGVALLVAFLVAAVLGLAPRNFRPVDEG
jgi:hypothetical protein